MPLAGNQSLSYYELSCSSFFLLRPSFEEIVRTLCKLQDHASYDPACSGSSTSGTGTSPRLLSSSSSGGPTALTVPSSGLSAAVRNGLEGIGGSGTPAERTLALLDDLISGHHQVDVSEMVRLRDAIVASGKNLHQFSSQLLSRMGSSSSLAGGMGGSSGGLGMSFSKNRDVNRSLASLLLSPREAAAMMVMTEQETVSEC